LAVTGLNAQADYFRYSIATLKRLMRISRTIDQFTSRLVGSPTGPISSILNKAMTNSAAFDDGHLKSICCDREMRPILSAY
jgi:hypothetical protein